MLFSEIIATVKDLPRSGNGESDDNEYTDRQIAFIINYYRAKLIVQDTAKGKTIDQALYQTLWKVELIKHTGNGCCHLDDVLGKCILRTKDPIPAPIDGANGNLFLYVGTVDGKNPFQKTTYLKSRYDSYGKFTGSRPKYYPLGDHLYVKSTETACLKYITVVGIFEDPTLANELSMCGCEGEENCFVGYDYEYPLDADKIDVIVKMIMSAEFKVSELFTSDTTNNTKDENADTRPVLKKGTTV